MAHTTSTRKNHIGQYTTTLVIEGQTARIYGHGTTKAEAEASAVRKLAAYTTTTQEQAAKLAPQEATMATTPTLATPGQPDFTLENARAVAITEMAKYPQYAGAFDNAGLAQVVSTKGLRPRGRRQFPVGSVWLGQPAKYASLDGANDGLNADDVELYVPGYGNCRLGAKNIRWIIAPKAATPSVVGATDMNVVRQERITARRNAEVQALRRDAGEAAGREQIAADAQGPRAAELERLWTPIEPAALPLGHAFTPWKTVPTRCNTCGKVARRH